MPQGLEVFNEANTLQVGVEPLGFNLIGKQVVNSSPNIFLPLGLTMSHWQISARGQNPICARRVPGYNTVHKFTTIDLSLIHI